MQKRHFHCGDPCKIIAAMDKNCGNESKISMASQNYWFFPCIFQIFSILAYFSGTWIRNIKIWLLQLLYTVHQMGPCQWKNETNCFVKGLKLTFPWTTLLLTGLNENPVHLHIINTCATILILYVSVYFWFQTGVARKLWKFAWWAG